MRGSLSFALEKLCLNQEMAGLIDRTAEVAQAVVAAEGAVVCLAEGERLTRADYGNTEEHGKTILIRKNAEPVCFLAEALHPWQPLQPWHPLHPAVLSTAVLRCPGL